LIRSQIRISSGAENIQRNFLKINLNDDIFATKYQGVMKPIFISLFFLISSLCYSQYLYDGSGRQVARFDENYIYNASGHQIGRIDVDMIYDGSGHQIGRIDGEYYYDGSGHQIGRVDGNYLYDGSGKQIGRLDGDYLYDESGQQIGRADGLRRKQVITYFYYFY
jgi:hypothetical protein